MVVTGWLQWWPMRKLRKFIPFLRIWWFGNLDLDEFDVIISSSGAEAKGIRAPRSAVHINYCHAPTHYYWSRYDEYMQRPGFGPLDPLARLGLKLLVRPMRKWDYRAAQRPDYIIANSSHIKTEIQRYYDRDSIIVHPPVYFDRFQKAGHALKPRKGFVISGRQTPYKRFDLAIEACNRLMLPLTVIGDGPDHRRLKALAGPTVTLLGRVEDPIVEEEFVHAEALIFPGLDDFGITPVEAMAAGTPVIAYQGGGALDYVKPNVSGKFFDEPTVESLVAALESFDPTVFSHNRIRNHAQQFSAEYFRQHMSVVLRKILKHEAVL
jgi:glycosyltransferase involved in cell wall biosynthesis